MRSSVPASGRPAPVVARAGDAIRFQHPQLPPAEEVLAYFTRSQEAGWYANGGPCAQELSTRLGAWLGGASFVLPVANCTVGLMASLRAVCGESRGGRRRVLTPSFTFTATACAIHWAGFEPVFVDVDEDAWCMDPAALDAALDAHAGAVAGVLACATFGTAPPDAARAAWRASCERHGVPLLLDSAPGFGAVDEAGVPLGGQGDTEIFSFHATKPFAIGEGGIVVSGDPAIAAEISRIINFGLEPGSRVSATPGLNGKMSELHAATALAMLDRFPAVLEARRELAEQLARRLGGTGVRCQRGAYRSPWQFFQVTLPEGADRAAALAAADRLGVAVRTLHDPPLHRQPAFVGCARAGALATTESLAANSLSLPLANTMPDEHLDRIAAVVTAALCEEIPMLNWLARYAPAGAMLLEDGRAVGSILDVGCGPHGLACAHPDVPFVGLDVEFPAPVAPSMIGIEAPAGPLPFADGAFDTVVSLDTLEHIPRPDRAGFVAELARVAARRVLLACPTDEGAALDTLVRDRFLAAGGPVPDWLAEHDEHVLPARDEIQGFVDAVPGFRARPWPMVNGLLAGLLPWADLFEFSRVAAAEASARREEWVRLLEHADFGPSFRGGWVLERVAALTPIVGVEDPAHDVAAALRCLACGTPHAWSGDTPACTACGRELVRAPSNAWRLAAAPTPEPEPQPEPQPALAAPASRGTANELLLAPDWGRPETWLAPLAAYLSAADPADDVTLYVDGTCDLGLDVVAELMGTACEHLAGDTPFADVAIAERVPAGATLVRDVAEMREALGVTPEDPTAWSAEEIVQRGRWGKVLADGVRALADLRRYEAAPGPWDDAEPLVTVRIPTWNGVESLLGRAIPSVLGGQYQNVEVLVCSDGPDPAARAAVTGLADRRVRYLELPERPDYASHPHSFWQTAGIRAVNAALEEARGAWIAPLDHDDVFTYDHITTLLAVARHHKLDMTYGDALCERPDTPPMVVGHPVLQHGGICHGSVLYSSRLAHLRYDEHSWLDDEPGDWNLWRRMRELGAGIGHVPRVVLSRAAEHKSREAKRAQGGDHTLRANLDVLARDILETSAAWYLDVTPIRTLAAA